MGRPLNKRFFGDLAGRIACSADVDGSGAEAAFIVEQRSNAKYRVQTEASFASTALVVGVQYQILTVSSADYTTVGAANNDVGTVFTATGTSAGGTGTADARAVCVIVATAPNPDEMRVEVQAENATAPVEATFTFGTDATVNNATVISIAIVTGGYGYWVDGTFELSIASDAGYAAGTQAEITYTVANGSIATVQITGAGIGYTEDLVAAAVHTTDAPNEVADPPLQYARIINARQVKTFEGNTYDWPITAPLGTPAPNVRTQTYLQTQ